MGARRPSLGGGLIGLCTTILLAAMLLVVGPARGQPAAPQGPQNGGVIVLDVDGAIGPATTEYVKQGLTTALERGARLVVIRMDTPGGLDSSTRDIIAEILASPVPVATFVAPPGARAASAGTYILYASHLAAMAPGTHLGAATPVQIGGGGSPLGQPPDTGEGEDGGEQAEAPADAMTAKAVNDSVAYIRSLAALQGRNAEWAERAVREAATLTSQEALEQNVIEVRAADLDALLAQADGRTVQLQGRPHVLQTAGAPVTVMEPDWRSRILGVITDPNIAYLLLLVGVYGLIFEFMSPGTVGPGVIGAVALVVGLFALNLLPVNYAGLALVALGVALMAVEAFTPTFGVFGIGGAVAFGLGSLILFRGPVPEFQISPYVVLTAVGLSLVYFVFALGAAVRGHRRPVAFGGPAMTGAVGEVVSWSDHQGLVHLNGENWQAHGPAALAPGQHARVVARDGLTLTVEPEVPPKP